MDDRELDQELQSAGREWRRALPAMEDGRQRFERSTRKPARAAVLTTSLAASALSVTVAVLVLIAFATKPVAPPAAIGSDSERSAIPFETAAPGQATPSVPASTPSAGTTDVPSVGPTDSSAWISLGYADTASWSPDGRHIGLSSAGSSRIVDKAGSIVREFPGADELIWLDETRVLLLDRAGGAVAGVTQSAGPNGVYVTEIGRGPIEYIGQNADVALTNGMGAVAFSDAEGEGSFVVSDGGSWSDRSVGYALAWSPQGDHLAVMRLREARIGLEGLPAVLSWPPGTVIAEDPDNRTGENFAQFDPTGRYLAYMSYGAIHVLDTDEGDVRAIGPDTAQSWFGWTEAGLLVIADTENGTCAAYAMDGSLVEIWNGLGDSVDSSPDGSTLVFYTIDYATERPPLSVLSEGELREIALPAGNPTLHPLIAPDGGGLVILSAVQDGQLAFVTR